MDNVDRKAIFEFDFDPRIYRNIDTNGKQAFEPVDIIPEINR